MDASIEEVMARRGVQPQVQVSRSVLASRLVELWSWGVLSSNSVQYLAEGCVMDGNSTTEVQNLATIGASGLYPQNCRRDLLRRYVGKAGVPQPLVIRTPLLASNGTIELGTTALISPCEMFHRIVTEFPRCAERILAKEVRSFWEAVPRDDPRILAHNDIDFDRTIPLVLHGDGGRFIETTHNSLLVVSWRSLLCSSFDFGTVLLFALPKQVRCKHADQGCDSTTDLWQAIVHLLNALHSGTFPGQDHLGQPWPGGSKHAHLAGSAIAGGKFRAVVWNITGDLPFLAEELGFPHCNSNDPCWFCGCNRADAPFTDVRQGAEWRRRLVPETHPLPCLSTHPVWELAGFSRWCVLGDLMHTGCLGVLEWFLGAVMWELVFDGPFAGSIADRLQTVWASIKRWYAKLQVQHRFSQITLEMFRHAGSYAQLKGKAVECSHLLPVLAALCEELGCQTERDQHRLRALKLLAGFYRLARVSPLVPSRAVAGEAVALVDTFLLHYHWLGKVAMDHGRLLYNFPIKFHYLWHIARNMRFQSPVSVWCYGFESFVGRIVRCAQSCTAGTSMSLISHKVAMNFACAFDLYLQQHGQ